MKIGAGDFTRQVRFLFVGILLSGFALLINVGLTTKVSAIESQNLAVAEFVVAERGQLFASQSQFNEVYFTALAADSVKFEPGLRLVLEQNIPNPFSVQTSIGYTLDADRAVRLVLYDAFYNDVEVLVDEEQSAGRHQFVFVPDRRYSSGMYFYSLEIEGKERQTRRMLFLR